MNSAAARLPPLDPNLAPDIADADAERRRERLRRLIATGSLSPLRLRQVRKKLRVLEAKPHKLRALEAKLHARAA